MNSVATRAEAALAWCFLVILLITSPVGTTASGLLAAALVLPLAFGGGSYYRDAFADPAMRIFIGVFVALTACFAVTALEADDMLYAVNFLPFLVAPVVYAVAARRAGPRLVTAVSILCLVGAGAGLAFAVFSMGVLHFARAAALIGTSNLMPRVILPIGFLALCGLLTWQSRWRYILLAAPAMALVATLLSQSRGALLAVPVMGLLALGLIWSSRRDRRLVLFVVGLGVVATLAAGIVLGPTLANRFGGIPAIFGEFFRTGATADTASEERLVYWRAGIAAFRMAPWFGWGWAGQGRGAVAGDPQLSWAREGFIFHNDAIAFAVAAGVVGIVSLALLLAAPVIGAAVSGRDRLFGVRLYAGLMLGLGFLVFGLTDFTIGYDIQTTLFAFLTAIVLGGFREPKAAAP